MHTKPLCPFSGLGSLAGALFALSVALGTQATQLAYTNTQDNWTLPTSWKPNNNWSTGTAKTNAVNTDVRLNLCGSVTYDATMGTTMFDVSASGSETRAMFVNTNNTGTVTLTINGGTLKCLGESGSANYGTILIGTGTAATLFAGTANVVVNGGTLDVSSNGVSPGEISILPRGINGASGTLTINAGAVLADVTSFATLNSTTNGTAGTLNLNGGSLSTRVIISRQASANSVVNFNGGTLISSDSGNGAAGAWIRSSPVGISAYVKAGGAKFDTAGQNNQSIAVPLQSGGGTDGGVTKLGLGSLTLSALNTYNGPTIVSNGTLSLTLPISSGSAVVGANGTLAIAVANNTWSVSSLTAAGGNLNLNYGALAGTPAPVVAAGTLTLSGNNVINITGSGFALGTTPLITYSSKSGTGTFVLGSVPAGIGATVADTGSAIVLNVTSIAMAWASTANGLWNTNGVDLNWNDNGTLSPFSDGKFVLFDDSGAPGTVTIGTVVKPSGIIVDDTYGYYTFAGSGTGQISGPGGLIKRGSSTLDLSTANSYDGTTTVEAGTLTIHDGGALGSTLGITTVSNGATLALAGGSTVSGETVALTGLGVGGSRGALRGVDANNNVWAGPVILAANQARLGTEDGGSLAVSGPILTTNGTYGLYLRPGVNGTLRVASTTNFYGNTQFFGDASGTGRLILGAANALSPKEFDLGPGTVDMNGFDQTFTVLGENAGAGTLVNNGPVNCTLTLTGTNNATWRGAIADGLNGKTINLVKTGAGIQTLGSLSTYTGATVVGAGGLIVGLPMSSSALTLADSTTLTVNVNGGSWSPATLSLTNATLNLSYGTLYSTPPAVFNAGALKVSGSNVINITAVSLPSTTVTLLSYSSKSGGGSFYLGTLPPNVVATLADTGSAIVLNVSFSPLSLTWAGFATGTWNTTGTLDWNGGVTSYQEYSNGMGDNVIFDDTAAVFSVPVANDVHPLSLTVSNNFNPYTLSGPGKIAGTVTLTKNGTNALALTGVNTYTGGTAVKAGTLSFVNGALGSSGNIVLGAPSTLQWAPGNTQDLSSRLRIDGTNLDTPHIVTLDIDGNDVVFASGLSLNSTNGSIANAVAKIGNGKLTLTNAVSTLGNVARVNAGTLEVVAGATLNLDGAGNLNNAALVSDGSTILINGGTVNVGDRLAVATLGGATGVVTIASGALNVEVGSTTSTRGIRLAGGNTPSSSNTATLNLDGGTLTTARIFAGQGTSNISILNFNGGLLQPSTNALGDSFLANLTHAYVKAGGARWDTAGTDLTIGQGLEHDSGVTTDGGLVKRGSGSLTLSGTNSYNGLTVVSNGALVVNGSLDTNLVAVWAGASLGGTGIISGPVSINAGGTLSPGVGAGLGALITSNSLTLGLGSTNLMGVSMDGGVPVSDLLVAGAVSYGGTLVVNNVGATALQAGNTFTLFQVTGATSGNFANITPAPGPGLGWSFNPANGVLSVVTAVSSKAVITGVTTSGANLLLSGTNGASGGTYYVLSSTNVALPVSSWTPVWTNSFDGAGHFSVTISNVVNAAHPKQFFLIEQ